MNNENIIKRHMDTTDRPHGSASPEPHLDVLRLHHAESSDLSAGEDDHHTWEILTMYSQETFASFNELREDTLKKMQIEYNDRMASNTKLNPEEYKMGAYLQEIEPQVRGAVLDLSRKGYITTDSGFAAGGRQSIMGSFSLDADTKNKLKSIDVSVEESTYDNELFTTIAFKPREANLQAIRDQWKEVTALIPKRGEMETNQSDIAKLTRSLDGVPQRMDTPEITPLAE